MKNFRILVIIVLLALAAPFIVHHRGWASTGQSEAAIVSSNAPSSMPGTPSPASNQVRSQSSTSSVPQPPASDLPASNSSLPLLSVIGFGILVGGVISALRTRSARK